MRFDHDDIFRGNPSNETYVSQYNKLPALCYSQLKCQPLVDLCCAKVASMIKGKTPEEIRRTFNIVNYFTPEEEAQVCTSLLTLCLDSSNPITRFVDSQLLPAVSPVFTANTP